jgi:FolB domain-containing protein
VDRIFIKDLLLRCIIGVDDEERREKQDVIVNVVLSADLGKACASDRIEDALDYRAMKKRIIAMVEASECFLIEALAERIAAICLEDPQAIEVRVTVEKPAALRYAKSVGVDITRNR